MQIETNHAQMQLGAQDLLVLHMPAGTRIECERGVVWVTVDGLPADTVLEPGESWQVPSSSTDRVIVTALDGSAMVNIH